MHIIFNTNKLYLYAVISLAWGLDSNNIYLQINKNIFTVTYDIYIFASKHILYYKIYTV